MTMPFPKEPVRAAIENSLPRVDPGSWSPERIPFTYVPASHARALEPDSVLVEGIRGAGKSFWWNALNQDAHRRFVASVFPETRLRDTIEIRPGYGESQTDTRFPSKDVIQHLIKSHGARTIWKAVVGHSLAFSEPFLMKSTWDARAAWVAVHPDEYERLLATADQELVHQGKICVIQFDALDRLADNWTDLRPIAKALFQLALDMRSCRAIRLKLFVRPDMVEDRELWNFPDASKVHATKVSLSWRKLDLYALMFQCLGNDPNYGGAVRDHCQTHFSLSWEHNSTINAWILPKALRTDEMVQRQMFHAISGPTMASGSSGHKRGFPYTWLPNRLADGRDQVSPRSFAEALREAARYESPDGWNYPLHFLGLKAGVQTASRIRVDELHEDYPWLNNVMDPLKQLVVPCPSSDLFDRWQKLKTVEKLRTIPVSKLPPQHLEDGEEGLLGDLRSLGLIQVLDDGRIQMPDVYRIAFGLGRKGGVRPVK